MVKPGKYVLAVSGGVDSMVLLHVLAADPGVELVVAHYDHGMRAESGQDRELVQQTAAKLGLPFVYEEGKLGANASEAQARTKRYDFLRRVMKESGAGAIITAHHQDDVLETMLLNMLRGTGRRGLSSLRSHTDLMRPLLNIPKADLVAYAHKHHIEWHEDSTNQDTKYRRNAVRHTLIPKLTPVQRAQLLKHTEQAREVNDEIDSLLQQLLAGHEADSLDRAAFIALPHAVARELLAAWLRARKLEFDRKTIERLVVFIKTAAVGKQADISDAAYLLAGKKDIALRGRTQGH